MSENEWLTPIIGRDEIVTSIANKLLSRRLVTIVGPGGIGKTRIAHAVVETLRASFDEPARFIDLGPLRDGALVPMALASALGLTVRSTDPLQALIYYLRLRRVLIVLDCCEHLASELAPVVERIIHEASDVFILATSREPLRIRAEYLNRIPPLAFPPTGEGIDANEAGQYPAVRLFVERSAAVLAGFSLTDANAPAVAEICRKLDGIALAIELAAASVPAHGVMGIRRLIADRFRLLIQGRRTASARHRTLRATLDWSYELLSPLEQTVFRRLAVFVGYWQLDAALRILPSAGFLEEEVIDALSSLTSKSLISVDKRKAITRYRLLDTTRAYALELLDASEEGVELGRRHALFYSALLDSFADTAAGQDREARRTALEDAIGNVREALRWCFSNPSYTDLGIRMTIQAGPTFLELSLLAECQDWAETALSSLGENDKGKPRDMELQELFGLCMLFTGRHREATNEALNLAYSIAEAVADRARQMQLLGVLHHGHMRASKFHDAMEVARLSERVAHSMRDRSAEQLAHWLLGMAHFHHGNHQAALNHLNDQIWTAESEQASDSIVSGTLKLSRLGIDHRFRARSARARCLWVSGFPDQAIAAAKSVVDDAGRHAHPITLCMSLVWTTPVLLLAGELEAAEQTVAHLSFVATEHALPYFVDMASGFEGELLTKRNKYRQAEVKLRECLAGAGPGWHPLIASFFRFRYAEALLMADRCDEALAAIETAMSEARMETDLIHLPEMLRIKARTVASMGQMQEAEKMYIEAIELSRVQCALSWEMRAATELAELLETQGRAREAYTLISSLYNKFQEGFTTSDIVRAKSLCDHLGV